MNTTMKRAALSLISLLMLLSGTAVPAEDAAPRHLSGLIGGIGKDAKGLMNLAELERMFKECPQISGVLLSGSWNDIETGPEHFDWTNLNDAVAIARKYGKTYKIKFQPGTSTPDWVYAAGAASFETTGSNPNRRDTYKKPIRIPVPWDPIYLQCFERFIEAAGAQFADDPYCAGIAITGANFQSSETHLPKGDADRKKWEALHYREHLPEAYNRLFTIFAKAFPRQQLCLHIAVPIRNDDGIMEQVVADAAEKYPDRFTLQNCQLSGKGNNANLYSYALIQRYLGRLHIGYQSLALLGSERQGDSQVSVYNFVRGEGEYWELWRGNSLDPEFCKWLTAEIKHAQEIGPEEFMKELKAAGKL